MDARGNERATKPAGYGPLRWLAREIEHTKDVIAPNGLTSVFSRGNLVKAAMFGAAVLALNNPLWTNSADAVKTAEKEGISDVSVTGYGWKPCGFTDRYALVRTRVEGTNAAGQQVSGTVCKVPFGKSQLKYD